PCLLGPIAEVEVRQTCERDISLGIDPEERPAAAEVTEGARRVLQSGPVRHLLVAELEAETPIVRIEAPEIRQDARETRELHRRRLVERLTCDEPRGLQLACEPDQIVERSLQLGRRRAAQLG